MGFLSQIEPGGELAFFQTHYELAKADIKKRLHIRFKRKYANTPNEWRTRAAQLYQEYLRRNDFVSGSNAVLTNGEFLEELEGQRDGQVLFFHSAVPTSSTYANTALNGDLLINTAQGGYLYINRGTSAVPSWVRWSYKDLTDNILNGSTSLVESAVAGTLYYMARYLSIPQNAGSLGDSDEVSDIAKRLLVEYNVEFNKEYEILDVDASGDGLMSNTEIEDQDSSEGWIVA